MIKTLHETSGRRVAVLVDEYDKPILDVLGTPEVARANRSFLRGLYSVIKDCDESIKFTLQGAGADQGKGLRRKVPSSQPAHPPDRGRVQQGRAQHRRL